MELVVAKKDLLRLAARMQGATFYSTGRYHHHLATNTWQSAGAPKRSGAITGLSSFEVLAQDEAVFDAAAGQWLAKGAVREGERLAATDLSQEGVKPFPAIGFKNHHTQMTFASLGSLLPVCRDAALF
jgi:hypothetical protein